MVLREAAVEDIQQMHVVRISVKENQLSNPGLISFTDYEDYLINRGKGWVVEVQNTVVGFAIVDLIDKNVWALFVHPNYEGQGYGRRLHDEMMSWYFDQTQDTIWLSTGLHTKAEKFYSKAGWQQIAIEPNGELRFEMSFDDWHRERFTE